ncbi:unnamed protein product [Candida verbasci]|uniref:Sphingomyelin phosphodiesterase n=1 Tax=Candida verbasci TaxID=1227364 RepID=A0A9W4TZM6_9ASCO|nr:unnamed protein product [Candida verbasci]
MYFLFLLIGVCLSSLFYYAPKELTITDEEIINKSIKELHDIDSTNDLNPCLKCKTRLQIAKTLSLTRPDLLPQIFSTWCIESNFNEIQCHMNYGYPTDFFSTQGNDFTKMVSLMNPSGLDGDYFCYYHDTNCNTLPETPLINLSKMWPKKPNSYLPVENSGEVFNVLHLSDINLQIDYRILSESNCSQSLCCSPHCRNKFKCPEFNEFDGYFDSSYSKNHFEKGKSLNNINTKQQSWKPARQFGEYSCDTPSLLLNSTLQCIRDLHQNHLDFEFAIFTGGTVDHSDRCFMSKAKNLQEQETTYRILKHYLDEIDVIPTFGIRDIFPMNQFPQKNINLNLQWQFDFLSDLWQELGWIDVGISKQIRYFQFGYSLITDRGLKIISLNSNIWNFKNLYNYWNITNIDSYGMWKWLINELVDSERNFQRCWIIAHLPPNHQSLPLQANIFAQIIERFSPRVIAAIFFGFTQKDQFIIQYGSDGTDTKSLEKAVNHALIAPSISPYSAVNPSWKYYSVDKQSFSIMNSFTYYTKLGATFGNNGAEPIWEFGYSTRDIYNLENWSDKSLNTEFYHLISDKINQEPEFNLLYQRLENRFTDGDLNNDSYCKITSFTIQAKKQCMITDDQDDYTEPKQQTDNYLTSITVGNDQNVNVDYVPNEKEEIRFDDLDYEGDTYKNDTNIEIINDGKVDLKVEKGKIGKSVNIKRKSNNKIAIDQL